MLEKLNEKSLLICNYNDKEKILHFLYEQKQIVPFKIMDINEFVSNMTFNYDTKTIYYVMQKFDVKYEVALVYLNSLKYITQKTKNEKLNTLYTLREDLKGNDLIKENNAFKEYIQDKKIIFYNLNYDLKFITYLCKDLEIEFINEEIKENYEKEVHHFITMNDEIIYVGNKIISLLESGIPSSKIKLVNISDEYNYNLNTICSMLNIKVNNIKHTLYGTIIGKYFIDNLKEDINETISMMKERFDSNLLSSLISICNKYNWCHNFIEIKDLLIYELKHTNIINDKYTDEIEIINPMDMTNDNYNFLLGFNNESIPKTYKDIDYITDNLCDFVHKETSTERFIREKDLLIAKIRSIKNLIITYKDKSSFNEYLISTLNDDLKYRIVEENSLSDISYSEILSKIDLAKELDLYTKYGEKSNKLEILNSNIKCDYKEYDNRFKEIDLTNLYSYLDNKLTLSYSAIDTYYKCAFCFYIKNILKLEDHNQEFSAYLGSLMHFVLSIYDKKDFNLDESINKYLNDNPYTLEAKESFFLEKSKDYLKFIIKYLQKVKLITGFDNELHEKQVLIEKNNKIKITFLGYIDKIMYLEKDGNTYVSIIDYKTGNIDTNLKYVNCGLQLQLPTYAYFVKNSNLFSNPIISGLYYQKLLQNDIDATTKEDYENKKASNLRLQGLSINDEYILSLFDSTYENSELIKGMQMTKTGISSRAKVFSKTEMDEMINLAEQKIDEAINDIVNGKFTINPKKIKNDNVGCAHCEYKDICFMTQDDIVTLEEGDEDAELD